MLLQATPPSTTILYAILFVSTLNAIVPILKLFIDWRVGVRNSRTMQSLIDMLEKMNDQFSRMSDKFSDRLMEIMRYFMNKPKR